MPSGPATPLGETRVSSYNELDLLSQILYELRAIKFMLCKIEGQTNFTEVDGTAFTDGQMPSGFPGI